MDEKRMEEQLAIANRLQVKWLVWMEERLDNKEITPTEMTTLYRFLRDNGWNLDKATLPKGLQEMVAGVEFDQDIDDDYLFRGG